MKEVCFDRVIHRVPGIVLVPLGLPAPYLRPISQDPLEEVLGRKLGWEVGDRIGG